MSSNYEQFLDCLEAFDNAMLVTRRDDELRARPMAIAGREDDGELWFFTSANSGKLDELREYPEVNISMQANQRFLSMSGKAEVSNDRERIEELWTELQRVWFPEGKDDPQLRLIRFVPSYAEYWDTAGLTGVRFAAEALIGVVKGERPDVPDDAHGKVLFGSAAK